jgi:hypothetical protein
VLKNSPRPQNFGVPLQAIPHQFYSSGDLAGPGNRKTGAGLQATPLHAVWVAPYRIFEDGAA